MRNAIIIHGLEGNPENHWFPWLKKELEKRNYTVHAPALPRGKNPSLQEWEEAFKEYRKHLDSDSIIIAHSLGVPFTLKVLEKKVRPVKAAFLVGGFISDPREDYDEKLKTFVEEFDFEEIKRKTKYFFLYASDNDEAVPLEKTKELSDKLGEEITIVEGAGHFTSEDGFEEFEDLLVDIISVEHAE